MKIKIYFLFFLITCFSFSTGLLVAQGKYNVSVFYNYSIRFENSKFFYPLGFGSSFTTTISDKLLLSTGIEYAHLFEEHQMKFTPGTYRTKEIMKESIGSFTVGISYPLIQKKFIVSVGADVIASRFWYRYDFYRYVIVDDQLDMYQKYNYVSNGIGLKVISNLQYCFSKGIRIFAQPGYTNYLIGEAKKNKMFNTSVGLIFSL